MSEMVAGVEVNPHWQDGFSNWMMAVDEAIASKVGLESADLVDCPYADWYDSGMTADKAATKAIANNY